MGSFPRMTLGDGVSYVEATGDNELKVVSLKKDPPFVRLVVREDLLESNMGGVSFGTERADGSGIDDQYAIIQGRIRADRKGGAVYIAIAPEKGSNVEEVLYIDNTVALFRVNVQAPNLGGGGGGGNQLFSADGRLMYQLQNDGPWSERGAIIVYDNQVPGFVGQWRATGKMVPVAV